MVREESLTKVPLTWKVRETKKPNHPLFVPCIETTNCNRFEFTFHSSESSLPLHVPSSDRQTVPSSYKFGLILYKRKKSKKLKRPNVTLTSYWSWICTTLWALATGDPPSDRRQRRKDNWSRACRAAPRLTTRVDPPGTRMYGCECLFQCENRLRSNQIQLSTLPLGRELERRFTSDWYILR